MARIPVAVASRQDFLGRPQSFVAVFILICIADREIGVSDSRGFFPHKSTGIKTTHNGEQLELYSLQGLVSPE